MSNYSRAIQSPRSRVLSTSNRSTDDFKVWFYKNNFVWLIRVILNDNKRFLITPTEVKRKDSDHKDHKLYRKLYFVCLSCHYL